VQNQPARFLLWHPVFNSRLNAGQGFQLAEYEGKNILESDHSSMPMNRYHIMHDDLKKSHFGG
jgi:hypothetical protein